MSPRIRTILLLALEGCAGADTPERGGGDVGEASSGTTADDDPGAESMATLTVGTTVVTTSNVDDTANGSSSEGTAGSSESSTSGGSETGDAPATWMIEAHSCPGPSRTDALLVEADAAWVGCGSNAVGYGLHTRAGLDEWAAVDAEPSGELDAFRVSAIARGDDGLLYVAGLDAGDGDMVLSLDTSATPMIVDEVLVAGNIVGTSFHVGSLALLSGGRVVAESLTGLGTLVRPDANTGSDATTWIDAYYWANGGAGPGYQMQDLFELGDRLYAAGATIAQPPYLFMPPLDPAAEPYQLDVLVMPNTGWTGEMWGVAATDDRVVVVGVDQDHDVGKIYVSGADPYEPSEYVATDLTDIIGDANLGTWARGVCMRDDTIVVVGERQPLSAHTGLVLHSSDAGATFVDITPPEVTESVSKCTIRPDGTLFVAGAGGFFGRYR
jgi:hypothetical protein